MNKSQVKEPEMKPFKKQAASNEIHLDYIGLDDFDRPIYIIENQYKCLIDTAGKNAEYPELRWASRPYNDDKQSAGEPEDAFQIPEEAELFVTSSYGYRIPENIKAIANTDEYKLNVAAMKAQIAATRKNESINSTKQKGGFTR